MSLLDTYKDSVTDLSVLEPKLRDRIKEIVRCYRHSWDHFSELIQNSVDAVNRRWRILNDPAFPQYGSLREQYPTLTADPAYQGVINIYVDVLNKTIEIQDNGIGIEQVNLERFLLPEETDKKRLGTDYGFKGFGLTFASFISEEFFLKSRFFQSTETYELSLNGLFSWLTDDSIPFPVTPTSSVQSSSLPFDDEDQISTIIRLKMANNYETNLPAISAIESSLDFLQSEEDIDTLEYIIRTRTCIGNTRYLFGNAPNIPINTTVVVLFPDGTNIEKDIPATYLHPKDHPEISAVSYDFTDYVARLSQSSFTRYFRGLYHVIPSQNIGQQNPIKCDISILVASSIRLSNIASAYKLDNIQTGDIDLSYGIYLSIGGMPTGIRIDDWDSRGSYLRRYFVIVDADLEISDQLDSGRKGISKYYAQKISDKVLELISTTSISGSDTIAKYATNWLDIGKSGTPILSPQEFQIKISDVRQTGGKQEQNQYDIINKLREVSSLTYLPTDEQEVIVLFYEMLSKGIIKGYKVVYQGGSKVVYDAGLEYEIIATEENIFPNDPLGIGQALTQELKQRGENRYIHRQHHSGITNCAELCVEFKQNIGALLEEIILKGGQTNKNLNDIDILVVWDLTVPSSIPSSSYTLDELQDNRRLFHSTTHRLGIVTHINTEIRCIVLSEILKKLL